MLRNSSLTGFEIPGVAEKLVTTLFADDTSAFLSRRDNWTQLWEVLTKWCKASKARFNSDKTEVIPIGSPEYRQRVVQTRRIEPDQNRDSDHIPHSVNIAIEGTAVRILGAWIGNGVEQAAVWTPTLQKIRLFLDRWGKCRPTYTGKRHIAQMGPAGISQYLSAVQGMPKSVETELVNTIRGFIWSGSTHPPISMKQLYK
ncbi:hypothetical protein FOMPIDRAFT_23211, partial [Fomitopsis schrenkii]